MCSEDLWEVVCGTAANKCPCGAEPILPHLEAPPPCQGPSPALMTPASVKPSFFGKADQSSTAGPSAFLRPACTRSGLEEAPGGAPTAMSRHTQTRALQPKPPGPSVPETGPNKTSFCDLPAELRIEIYRLALENVAISIVDPQVQYRPLPLSLVSRQINTEVRPLILQKCSITCRITDLNFGPLHAWLDRLAATATLLRRPSDNGGSSGGGGSGGGAGRNSLNDIESCLDRNDRLQVRLSFSILPARHLECRRWLHDRADVCRPQPRWRFIGEDEPLPAGVLADLRRRRRRMAAGSKRDALDQIMEGIEKIASRRRRRA